MKNQVKKIHSNQAYQLYYHGMMLPGFIFLILFNFVPMFGVIMAFQDYRPAKGFFGSDFVGLKHFKYLFEMPDSFELFRNTLIIALGKIVFTTIMSIAFAILLNEVKNRALKKSVQTVVYLPHFLSWVVLALVVKNLFSVDGSINAMLGTSLNWLGSNSLFQPLLILTDTWKELWLHRLSGSHHFHRLDPLRGCFHRWRHLVEKGLACHPARHPHHHRPDGRHESGQHPERRFRPGL